MGFWIPLAIAAGSAIASANAAKKAGKGSGAAVDLMKQGAQQFENIDVPTAQDLTYRLDNLVRQGIITPEQAKAYTTGPSAMEGVTTDPRLRAAQLGALSSLQDIGAQGGMNLTDRANLERITSREGQEERGSREAIMQRAAEQGRSGSGMELAAELENQQGAATRASQQGTDIAAQAQQRALQALMGAGQMGGQMEGQQFGEQSAAAQAKDALAKFNAEHLQGTEAANVAARNAAQEQNLLEQQHVADTNVQVAGENRRIATGAQQTAFQDEMDRRKAIASALTSTAQSAQTAAEKRASMAGNLIGAAGQVGSSLASSWGNNAGQQSSDKRNKDIEKAKPDMDAFMASLRPLAFKYKNPDAPGAGPGRHVGVVAQDVEKTPVGKTMVEDTPGGKMLNTKKGFGTILAALAQLHDEIDELKEKEGA